MRVEQGSGRKAPPFKTQGPFFMKSISLLSASFLALMIAGCSEEPAPAPEPEQAPEVTETAEPTPTPEPTETMAASTDEVVTFAIGELEAIALVDGGFTMPVADSPFNQQPVEDVSAALESAGLESETLSLSLHPMVLKTPDATILFDAGTGGPPAGNLMTSMDAAGVAPADISMILISHSHFDHVGGLVKDGALAFPNASILMSESEWAFMQANEEQAGIVSVIEPVVETFTPGEEIVPGMVTAVEVAGHTPGHSAFRIASGEETLLYVGDSVHHFVISVGHPGWKINFDTDEPTARASREALLAELAESGEQIYAYHFPFPGVGHIETSDDAFVYIED